MSIKSTLIVLMTVFFSTHESVAQDYAHTTFWAKTSLTTALTKRWDVQFEYVHRSQNNPRVNLWNPLNHESFEEPRLWFYFKQKNYTIQLNPITYFYSEALLGKEADFNIKPNNIWQSVVGLEVRQEVKKWLIKERFQYEYRWLQSLNYVPIGRLRLRGTVQYQLTPKTKIQALTELFLNAPPNKLTNNFDQNWSLVGVVHKINEHVNFEVGIMRNYRKRANGTEFDHETGINCGVNFRIL
jgi:Protein of unknown function (DUF2490)